jgi:hypothetical protein
MRGKSCFQGSGVADCGVRSVGPRTPVLVLDSLVAIIPSGGIIAAIRAIGKYKSCSADQLLTPKLPAHDISAGVDRSLQLPLKPLGYFKHRTLAGVRLLCEENFSTRVVLLFSCPSASLLHCKSQGFVCDETRKSYRWDCLSEAVGTLFRRSLARRGN